ncbi:uncharacterized protein RB166_015357 [Leptodactylus fuscus]
MQSCRKIEETSVMAMDSERIRHRISFDRILIQFFGFSGHGKSAFINSCKYVWEDGTYKNYTSATDMDGGHTLERRSYSLTENITLVDNRGFGIIGGYETGEIFAQLGNLLPLDEPVQWTKKYELIEKINQAKDSVRISDFVIPVLVYSIKKLVSQEEQGELKAVLKISETLTGIFPIVVLTHKTSGNLTEREATFRNMGVDRIFSIENYTPEDHSKSRGKHEEILNFLYEVIKDVQFQLNELRNPEREMRIRRKYVTMYVKEREKYYRRQASQKRKLLGQKRNESMRSRDFQVDPDHERQREIRLEEDITRMREMMACMDLEEEI